MRPAIRQHFARAGLEVGFLWRQRLHRLGRAGQVDGQAAAADVVDPVDGGAIGAACTGRVELHADAVGFGGDGIGFERDDLEVRAELGVDRIARRNYVYFPVWYAN